MVTRRGNTQWSIWGVDLACGAMVALLACVAIWLIITYVDRSGQELTEIRKELARTRQSLARYQVAESAVQAKIKKQTADLAQQGTLPDQFPIGSYFRDLTSMAIKAGVTVQSQVPMVATEYPGLVEQRSQFEVSGSLQSILTFFEAIEQSSYWADIGYFSLAQGSSRGTSTLERHAKFTISMFSANTTDDDQPTDSTS